MYTSINELSQQITFGAVWLDTFSSSFKISFATCSWVILIDSSVRLLNGIVDNNWPIEKIFRSFYMFSGDAVMKEIEHMFDWLILKQQKHE